MKERRFVKAMSRLMSHLSLTQKREKIHDPQRIASQTHMIKGWVDQTRISLLSKRTMEPHPQVLKNRGYGAKGMTKRMMRCQS